MFFKRDKIIFFNALAGLVGRGGACHSGGMAKQDDTSPAATPTDFLKDNPKVARIDAFVVDVNGVARGKALPRDAAKKLFGGGLRMPQSSFAFDIWGQDVIGAGLVAETGDNDGLCAPVAGRVHVMPWESEKNSEAAHALMSMTDADGKPFFADPRHVLANVLARFAKKGLTPVVALELEFYLVDAQPDDWGRPQPPRNPRSSRRAHQAQTYGLDEMSDFSVVLDDINAACVLQGIPADGTLSENGPAQYEINLHHRADALAAADDAIMLKRTIKGVAAKHEMMASFMAKPYGARSGSGMHVHVSLLDRDGRNVFAGEGKAMKTGSDALGHAIAGLLAAMPDSMAVLAPHANSYRRFRAGSHAPTTLSWGYDNRSAALRIPAGGSEATRIEHRVAGADANPYLLLAVILQGIFDGLEAGEAPPPALSGNAYASKAEHLPRRWEDALEIFGGSAFIDRAFGKAFKKVFLACKEQEREIIEAEISSVEHDAYLRDA